MTQQPGSLVWRLSVKGHERGGAAGRPPDIRAPLAGSDIGDFDVVLAPIDGFVVLVKDHGFAAARKSVELSVERCAF
jgi:hypothetical protein